MLCAFCGILAFALPIPAIIDRFQEHQGNVGDIKDDTSNHRIQLRAIFQKPMSNYN